MRRFVRRGAVELAVGYVHLNLLCTWFVPCVVAASIECRVVDAVTGAPVADALVRADNWSAEAHSGPAGLATVVVRSAPELVWALPMLGTFPLGGYLLVDAAGYVGADEPLPEAFEWPLFGSPRASVTVRLRR